MGNVVETKRSGGQILVDQLKIHGVNRLFCVPGESYLAALDSLYDEQSTIQVVTTRNEIGACNMAEAAGKLSGVPGICMVTRGPGASHAMVGIHTAYQDSTPLILFVGQVARSMKEREAFQEIDTKEMFQHTAKWAADITDAARIPEMVSHAFHLAVSGRPGPVVLGLPEDMLQDRCDAVAVAPYLVVRPFPNPQSISELGDRLHSARRPLLLVGGSGWDKGAIDDLRAFSERHNLPVCASFRCQDLFDNCHPNYVGDCSLGILPSLAATIRSCDVLVVLGARLGELTTQGYCLVQPPVPSQDLIHVHVDPDELSSVFQTSLPINSGMAEFLCAARDLAPTGDDRLRWVTDARAGYESALIPGACPGQLDLGTIVRNLSMRLPKESIITVDAGNFSGWINRFYQFSQFRTLLGPTNGAMGYGLPAAIAAKLAAPERTVVCFAGDGGFLMSGQEIATAVQYGVNVIVIVVNNGMYGTIRMYQEREYPGRSIATDLRNPDFAAYAKAFGAYGEVVTATDQFEAAFDRAYNAGLPAILDLRLDREAISSSVTLTQLRNRS